MRHRTLLLIAAVTGLLACACGGTEAERLHRAAMREYLDPIRPGYEGRNPFWNAFATKFIYAPAFGFEPVENAVKYRFTVSHLGTSMVESPRYRKDAPTEDPEPRRVLGPGVPTGRSWSFEADSPQQSLAPVWNDIPAGRVRVTAEGLDASGRVLGKAGEREFLRDFPFRPPYNGNVRPYAEAARMAALYIHELPAIRRWLTAAEPDMTYRHNTYACKIVGATIQLEVLVAKLLPAHREEALAIARNAARFLMDRSRPEGDPLAFFPPTYYSDLISSSRAENRGKTMTMEACAAGNAFLDLYDATGDRICYDRALAIAETYSRLQHADGSFPIKVDFETGEPVNGCKAMLTPVMEYFGRLENQYGVCLARAAEWMRRNALESFDLTGQFEDMTVLGQQPYQNLTNCASAPYASWLLKKPGRTAAELAALREKGLAGTTPDAEPVVNLYALREYAARYLKGHPGIHPDLMQMVRMLQPTPEGIPVEVYCFTRETDWVAYEAVQGAVFDHLFAVLPDFGLRAYQRSSDREPQSSES